MTVEETRGLRRSLLVSLRLLIPTTLLSLLREHISTVHISPAPLDARRRAPLGCDDSTAGIASGGARAGDGRSQAASGRGSAFRGRRWPPLALPLEPRFRRCRSARRQRAALREPPAPVLAPSRPRCSYRWARWLRPSARPRRRAPW
eukprot:scaffold977_cov253-Pinguiococcus_pyrenoidosus.AAC.17